MTKKYVIISIVTVLITLIGASLAYYTIQIIGTGSDMTIETAYFRMIFTDNTSIVEEAIEPGWSTSKTFTVENKYGAATTYDLLINNFQNTFVTNGFLQFKIVSSDGFNTVSEEDGYLNMPKSQSSRTLVLAHSIPLAKDATHEYTIYLRYKDSEENQAPDMQKILSGNLGIQNGTEESGLVLSDLDSDTLKYHILKDNYFNKEEWLEERPNFSSIYNDSYKTFFKTNNAELGETVFYYSGDARNNWVIFGKCPETGGKNCTPGRDLYWRIIRTNEESTGGGIRLLYSGSGLVTDNQGNKIIAITQNGYIGTSNWYAANNTPYNVGYTKADGTYTSGTTTTDDIRGNDVDSNLKIAVDNFYKATFENTEYEDYIDTKAVFCNDRSGNTVMQPSITFGFNKRRSTPSYACGASTTGFKERIEWAFVNGNSKEDRYSKEAYSINGSEFTNGYLDYPIALMTADEVTFAGGKSDTNSPNAWYYLNANATGTTAEKSVTGLSIWWTMSPSNFNSLSAAYPFYIFGSNYSGLIGYGYGNANGHVSNSYAVRPVLSLTANTKWLSGNGTIDSPYQISVN